MTNQNKPGRPPGSSRLNARDDLDLKRIADRMILDSTLKMTPVMVALGIDDETTQRRLRRKWKPAVDHYLQDARQRREEAAAEARREALRQIRQGVERFGIIFQQTRGNIVASFNRWAEENTDLLEKMRATAERMREQSRHLERTPR